MFGRSKPVVIDRYASRRSQRALPRWVWLLLFGAALGAGAVVYVQETHLPPRLSSADSGRLQSALASTEAERARLAAALAGAQDGLRTAQAGQQRASAELERSVGERAALRASIDALLTALPPDPRGSPIEVRSGRFGVDGGRLAFDVVLSRAVSKNDAKADSGAPFNGTLQFAVAGTSARGSELTLTLDPVPVTVARFELARGALPLPAGFVPREVTLRVLDRADGKPMGLRVFYVK